MRIAILGASSLVAADLVCNFVTNDRHDLVLYARNPSAVKYRVPSTSRALECRVCDFSDFGKHEAFDVVMNFVGAGDPKRIKEMGASILDITRYYDDLAIEYVKARPSCRYLFLSSGAVYGGTFSEPADEKTQAAFPINNMTTQDWYGAAKFQAECRHRALAQFAIVDIRVFNYISRRQDLRGQFFISQMIRAIRDGNAFVTTATDIVRDYLHPSDFHKLISVLLSAAPVNRAFDCYSQAPISKSAMLASMSAEFGLRVKIDSIAVPNATREKLNYFSRARCAGDLGYHPTMTSLEGIRRETVAILGAHC